ncbi:hypothetical protein [Streptomyces sp. NPDC054757]
MSDVATVAAMTEQAHAAAQIGEHRSARQCLAEAELAMDRAESRGKPLGSYDPASFHYHTSQVRYEMGDLTGAVAAMQESDKLRYGVYRRTRVKERAILAERQLAIGHLEAACSSWQLALDDYPQVNSGRIDKRMADMFNLIAPHLRNRDAQALNERARTIVRTELIPA